MRTFVTKDAVYEEVRHMDRDDLVDRITTLATALERLIRAANERQTTCPDREISAAILQGVRAIEGVTGLEIPLLT